LNDNKHNEVLDKMKKLLVALDEHMDKHEDCCLKKVVRSTNGETNE